MRRSENRCRIPHHIPSDADRPYSCLECDTTLPKGTTHLLIVSATFAGCVPYQITYLVDESGEPLLVDGKPVLRLRQP